MNFEEASGFEQQHILSASLPPLAHLGTNKEHVENSKQAKNHSQRRNVICIRTQELTEQASP